MRVLSVKQPYAALIVKGVKQFEARSWATDHRGRIAIHASSSLPPDFLDAWDSEDAMAGAFARLGWIDLNDLRALPKSAVIGTVDVVNVHLARQIWPRLSPLDRSLTYGEATTQKELPAKAYLWELAQPAEIGARPINGKLNLWTLPDAFANKVALAEARARRSIRKHVVDRKRAAASRRARADRIAREQWPDVVVKPSAMLAAIVGSRARTRSDLLDRVWSYVGARKLYSKDSRRILPDPRVAAILGARAVSVNALSEALTDYVDTLKPVR